MKIDLHVHCRERSICGRASEGEQIRAAIAAGLDGLVFTDHDRLADPGHIEDLNGKYAPFRIYGGVEVSLPEEEHILVLGVQDPTLERREWSYTTLWRFVRRQGGFLALAHPFRFHNRIDAPVEEYPPDGIEVYSMNTKAADEVRIRMLARRLGIGLLSDSDAHWTEPIGKYYNEVDCGDSYAGLVQRLREGKMEPVFNNHSSKIFGRG